MDKKQIIEDYLQGRHPMEQQSWELPSDSELEHNEALFDALLAEKKAAKRKKLWPYATYAVAVAACIVLAFILWPDKSTIEAPVVAEVVEQTSPEPVGEAESSEISEPIKPHVANKPNIPNRTNKAHRSNRPQSEPVQEEAKLEYQSTVSPEPMLSEDLNIRLLAAAQARDIRSRGERLSQEVALLIEE